MKERFLISAFRFEIGLQSFYDLVGKPLYKEVAELPRAFEGNFDEHVTVDGRKFVYMGQYHLTERDGSQFLVANCGVGRCGKGEKEYQELLDAGWLTEEQQFGPAQS